MAENARSDAYAALKRASLARDNQTSGYCSQDVAPSMGEARPDFDEEARKLFKQLNLPETGSAKASEYNDADAVWAHPETGAVFYIGNLSIASSKSDLEAKGIRNIVNCQEAGSENFHEKDWNFSYLRFPITHWMRQPGVGNNVGFLQYMEPFFNWVDSRMERGENVMVHCLAGAHRAGTAGTAYVMHRTKMSAKEAVTAVRARRPFVEPIYDFADLLRRLEKAQTAAAKLEQ